MNTFVSSMTLFCILLFTANVSAAPILINGSFTGPINNASLPPGWSAVSGSPDTMDENNNLGLPFNTFQVAPSPSPDGGTWVGMAADGVSIFETLGQTVTGFDIGTTYDVSWYHANFGHAFGFDGTNAIELLIDGLVVGGGPLLALSTSWIDETVSFTATSTSHAISFRLQDNTTSYHSIDGIRLRESDLAPVPLPAGLGLFCLALATLRLRR